MLPKIVLIVFLIYSDKNAIIFIKSLKLTYIVWHAFGIWHRIFQKNFHFFNNFLNCINAPNTILEFERYLVTDWYHLFHERESLRVVEVRTWQLRCILTNNYNYIFKGNNRNTRKRCRHWRRSGVFIVKFEHISHFVLVFLLLTLSR